MVRARDDGEPKDWIRNLNLLAAAEVDHAAALEVERTTEVFPPATYLEPSRHPVGLDHVIVNGGLAVEDGRETGTRTGRLLRLGA